MLASSTQAKTIIFIGYSGHAFVVIDAAFSTGWRVLGYCERSEKSINPFSLSYLGRESHELISSDSWFVAIGDNAVRRSITEKFIATGTLTAVSHRSAIVGAAISIGRGTYIGANAVVNSNTSIGTGCIINTAAVVEHDCTIGDYVHVCPGATLTGNVKVGDNSLVGAGAVVIPGVTIGRNVTIGAGSVVIKDVPDGHTMVGNPARQV